MSRKLIIVIIAFVFPFFAFAQRIQSPPADVRGLLPESDWVELYCLEARVEGGSMITRIESLAELLVPVFKEAEASLPDFKIPTLNSKESLGKVKDHIDVVCGQTILENSQSAAENFIKDGERIKTGIDEFVDRGIVSQLKAMGDGLKEKIEKGIKSKAAQVTEEAETRLRAESEAEAKTSEENLKARSDKEKSDLENSIKKELIRGATSEIQARAQTGEFGETPDMTQLSQMVEQMVAERAPAAASVAQKSLREKYDRLAKEAEDRLNAKYANLAAEEEQKIRKTFEGDYSDLIEKEKNNLESMAEKFKNLRDGVDVLAREKFIKDGWIDYYNQLVEKKKLIISTAMAEQIQARIKVVESYASAIDAARVAGKDIPTAQELINQLNLNIKTMVSKLAKRDLSPENIRAAAMDLSLSCDVVRFALEKAIEPKQTSAEIYRSIKDKLDEFEFNLSKIQSINEWFIEAKNSLKYSKSWDTLCEMKELKSPCVYIYNSMNVPKYQGDLLKWAGEESKLSVVLKEFLKYDENSESDALSDYKKRLVDSLTEYKKSRNFIKQQYPEELYFIVGEIKGIYSALLPRQANETEKKFINLMYPYVREYGY